MPTEVGDRCTALEAVLDRHIKDSRAEIAMLSIAHEKQRDLYSTLATEFAALKADVAKLKAEAQRVSKSANEAKALADESVAKLQDISAGMISAVGRMEQARAKDALVAQDKRDEMEGKRNEAAKAHAQRFDEQGAAISGLVAANKKQDLQLRALQSSSSKNATLQFIIGAVLSLVMIITTQCNESLKIVYRPVPAEVPSK